MKNVSRLGGCCAALLALVTFASTASAAEPSDDGPRIEVVDVAGVQVARQASAGTRPIIASAPAVAVAAAGVCGAGYTISTGAARYGRYGTAYTWTNGRTTGGRYYDKPICAVFFNDTGAAHSMGVRLKDNYTATPDVEDFGTYSSYAGPVYQNKGYCGRAYSYMKVGNAVVVDNYLAVGTCN
ncbi:hypothetical protein ACIQKE_09560 [Streptomyces griseoviridis]|uniref:hypothetical protein n=1 Tax=Streptomyces TaxID=1883 RepID=UPI001F0C0A35|nr:MULTISPECIES: hypothetical protein [Streptomyces]MDH6696167.1 hypothetical protein [Streptomyces sp. MAA16]